VNTTTFPQLRFVTARLSAEPVSAADFPFFHALWSDERVARTLGGVRSTEQVRTALAEAVAHWEAYGFGRWILRHQGIVVGTVKLAHCRVRDRAEVELGYALLRSAWGCGYATEAGAGALCYARQVASLDDVVAYALLSNVPSLAVLDRLGFAAEAELDLPAGRHRLYRKVLAAPLIGTEHSDAAAGESDAAAGEVTCSAPLES
jgi:ribosomal-protein-alanine N-acetyltransferase